MSQIMNKTARVGLIAVGLIRKNSAQLLIQTNNYSTKKEKIQESDITKSVFISQSTDIFTNLAMEDWIYRNMSFNDHHILMLWRNDPCVVIGRHQNPWHEANVCKMMEQGIELARRNSGGGTVYHDRGNLNMTFFTPRERYNRKYNLNLLTRALFREWGLKTAISPREDLVMQGNQKISGTAAKLGQPNSYHHCTLLANVNKLDLSQVLHKHESGIVTNATPSVRTPVTNLIEHNNNVSVDRLVTAIGYEYLRTSAITLNDGGRDQINKQRGFQLINPTEDWFPGLTKLRDGLASWDWRFGKTPKFSISRSFSVPMALLEPYPVSHETIATPKAEINSQELKITMSVEKGIIDDVTLTIPPGLSSTGFHGEAAVVTSLKGKQFSQQAMDSVENALAGPDGIAKLADNDKFVVDCFKQVVNNV